MSSRLLSLFSRSFKPSNSHIRFPQFTSIRRVATMSNLTVELTAPNGVKYTQPTGLFINNEWVPSSKGNKITSINPTDESEIASVHAAEPEDVDRAVEAAR